MGSGLEHALRAADARNCGGRERQDEAPPGPAPSEDEDLEPELLSAAFLVPSWAMTGDANAIATATSNPVRV